MNNDSNIPLFMQATRACAMQMLSNASYIQRELPSLDVPAELRAKIETVCGSLVNTKHDVITEIFELEELQRDGASEERLSEKMERISKWLCESIEEMHELVQEVQQLVSHDPSHSVLFVLIIESATNIANSLPGALSDEE
ncbi:hypothetical protein [Prosthecobacter sp.]|jgi:hypothetical protein|uniref:hypothetical protein n=1 Tax=Prosthecobacter sp. TaxID=1965333 RepID=UPI003782F6FF